MITSEGDVDLSGVSAHQIVAPGDRPCPRGAARVFGADDAFSENLEMGAYLHKERKTFSG